MISDYLGSNSPERPLLRREVESLRPPRSGEVICCLAWILGESRDSRSRLGLDARADNGISSGASRTIRGKSRDPLPFFKIRAENRRFFCPGSQAANGGAREKQPPRRTRGKKRNPW